MTLRATWLFIFLFTIFCHALATFPNQCSIMIDEKQPLAPAASTTYHTAITAAAASGAAAADEEASDDETYCQICQVEAPDAQHPGADLTCCSYSRTLHNSCFLESMLHTPLPSIFRNNNFVCAGCKQILPEAVQNHIKAFRKSRQPSLRFTCCNWVTCSVCTLFVLALVAVPVTVSELTDFTL